MLNVHRFVFSPIQENTYVIFTEDGLAAIVDPGCYFEAERLRLQQFITQQKLTVKYLINTHCHLDHVFGNKFVAATYQVLPHLHALEKVMLSYAPTSGEKWGLPFENYEGPTVDIAEGDTLQLGKHALDILFVPGHSPGHICLYHKPQNFVIAGDTLFKESIGRTDLPMGHHGTLIKAIQEKLFTLPDETVVYPGHGESTTIGWEKQHNPFM